MKTSPLHWRGLAVRAENIQQLRDLKAFHNASSKKAMRSGILTQIKEYHGENVD